MTTVELGLDQRTRQSVLDASLDLLWCRREAIAGLDLRGNRDVEIVASGDISAWTMDRASGWKHLLSTRASASGAALARSLPVNRRSCAEHGLNMVSVFDLHSTDDAARVMLEHEPSGDYYYAFAPLQMKLVDHRQVLMQGDIGPARNTLISLTSLRALRAAERYWAAVSDTAVPCRTRTEATPLTDRQCAIFDLMRLGNTDTAVARALAISVRTVRGEVSVAEQALGVRSRFAAGFAYAALLRRTSSEGSRAGDGNLSPA